MSNSRNRRDRERESFRQNPNDGIFDRRVADLEGHDKLDAILGALGGSTDTTPTIFNVAVAAADTEESQALPANCKGFIIRARGRSRIQLAYESGESGITYITIPPGASFEDRQFYQSQTLYFQTSKAGETVELLTYT